jgi:multiple sugar transport system substrate-binding protein
VGRKKVVTKQVISQEAVMNNSKRLLPLGGAALLLGVTLTALAQNTTLTHWWHPYGAPGQKQAVYKYSEDYSKASGVPVEVTWVPTDYGTKLNAALAAGTGPDVFEDWITTIPSYARNGHAAPLDDLFTPAMKADYNARAIEQVTYNGKIYGVKIHSDLSLVYYRKSQFKAAGLKPPKTFAELLAAAKKLTTATRKGIYVGNNGIGALADLMPASAGNFDFVKNNKVAFNSPRTIQALTALRQLNREKVLLIGAPAEWWEIDPFLNEQVAMQFSGGWAITKARKAFGDDFGVFPWPALDARGTPASFDGGFALMINSKSKNIDAAKKYIKKVWLDSTEVPVDWNTKYEFHVPPRKSVAKAANFDPEGPEAVAVDVIEKYGMLMPDLWFGAISTPYYDAVGRIVKNDDPIAPQLKAAADQSTKELNTELARRK